MLHRARGPQTDVGVLSRTADGDQPAALRNRDRDRDGDRDRDRDRDRGEKRDLRDSNAVGHSRAADGVPNSTVSINSGNVKVGLGQIQDDWATEENAGLQTEQQDRSGMRDSRDMERVSSTSIAMAAGGASEVRPTVRLSVGAIMRSRTAQAINIETNLTGGGLDGQENPRVGQGPGKGTGPGKVGQMHVHAVRPATEGSSAAGTPAPLPLALLQPRPQALPNANIASQQLKNKRSSYDYSNNFLHSPVVPAKAKAAEDNRPNGDTSPKPQRPRSRKLYLGSAKQQDETPAAAEIISSNYDISDPSARGLPRPTSRKLYLGSDTTAGGTSNANADTFGNRNVVEVDETKQQRHLHPRSAGVRPSAAAESTNSNADVDVAETSSARTVLKRLSSFAGFASLSLTSASSKEKEKEARSKKESKKLRQKDNHADRPDKKEDSSSESDADSKAVIRALALQDEEQRPPSRQASAFPVRLDSAEAAEIDDERDTEAYVKDWDEPCDEQPPSSPAFMPRTPPRQSSQDMPIDLNELSSDDEIFTRRTDRAFRRNGCSEERTGDESTGTGSIQNNSVISSIRARLSTHMVTASPIQTGSKHNTGSGKKAISATSASPITQKLLLEHEQQKKAATARYVTDSRPVGGDGSPNLSIFQVNASKHMNGKGSDATTIKNNNHNLNQYDRADLPTRGVCDPISDGFALLGDDDGRWPFAIQVNYSSGTKHRKGSGTLKTGAFTNPGIASSPSNLGVIVPDATSERPHNPRKTAHADDLLNDKLGAATIAIKRHSPVEILQYSQVRGPSKQFAADNTDTYNSMSPVAPLTPVQREPKRSSPANHMSESSGKSISKETTAGINSSGNGVVPNIHSNEKSNRPWSSSNSRGVMTFGAQSTTTSTSSIASKYENAISAHASNANNMRVSNWGSDGSDDDGDAAREGGRKWDGSRWVYCQDLDGVAKDEDEEEDRDFQGEEEEDEGESFDFEDGGFGNSSREVNGIFNIQAEMLGSSLGDDFLSLFANHAPPRPPAVEKRNSKNE